MTIADLLTLSHLRMSLKAGQRGLTNLVEWAHISDLPDPAPWVESNDLLLSTGQSLARSPAKQCDLIRSLIARGASGFALPTERAEWLAPDALAIAEQRGFPILGIDILVPYGAVTRIVAASNAAGLSRRMLVQLQIFETLGVAVERGRDGRALFDQLEEVTNFRLYLSSMRGTPLLSEVRLPPPELMAGAADDAAAHRLTNAEGFAVPVWVHGRKVGRLFALADGSGSSAGIAAAQHVATIVAVEYMARQRERELLRRNGAETLARLTLDGAGATERVALLERSGFSAGVPIVMFAARRGTAEIDDAGLSEELFAAGIPHLLLRDEAGWSGLVPQSQKSIELLNAFGDGCHVGLSGPFRAGDGLTTSLWQARWAVELARDQAVPRVQFGADRGIPSWLPPEAARLNEIVDEILGPILAHDAGHNGDLVQSLRCYLRNDKRLKLTAEELHVHPHTLAHRLRRVEELTGRKVASVKDGVDLWLALRALDQLDWRP